MRLFPAVTLLVLPPFVGEFLLGNITPNPAAWAAVAVPLVLLYGAGAVLIREISRRVGGGYLTMALLALAYALVEEGVVLGTLFNRDYLGLGLLEYGWMPGLGTSMVWSGYVVGIHVVWSMLVPIALAEHLFPARGRVPWLGVPGTVVIAMLYLFGAALLGAGNYFTYGFFPSTPQITVVLTLAAAAVLAGLALRLPARVEGVAPGPLVVALGTFGFGSAHILIRELLAGRQAAPHAVTLVLMAAVLVGAVVMLLRGSRRAGWTTRHSIAAAGGALATYCWAGFLIQFSLHGFSVVGLLAQAGFVLLACGILALCWTRAASLDGAR